MVLPFIGPTRESPGDIYLEWFDVLASLVCVFTIRRGDEKSVRRFSNQLLIFYCCSREETLVGENEESLRGKLEREKDRGPRGKRHF